MSWPPITTECLETSHAVEARPAPIVSRRSVARATASVRRGTCSGWAMRGVYFVSDLAAIGSACLLAEFAMAACWHDAPPAFGVLSGKLYALLVAGLLLASAIQKTYAAIPPRPVRQFRGWVLSVATVCI